MRHKQFLGLAMILALVTVFAPAQADAAAYPRRPITLIIPYGAGGITDILGRLIATSMSKELGVNVVVKNVVGAGTTLAANELAAARPDGYTVGLLTTSTLTIQPHLLKKLEYNVETFIPIAELTREYQVMMGAKRNAPWKDYKSMIEELKKNPGKYFYISTGSANVPHIAHESLFKMLGLDVRMLPVKSGAEAVQALYAGTAQIFTEYASVAKPNELFGIAVWGPERLPMMPDVPTLTELGVENAPEVCAWMILFAPPKTPQNIIDTLRVAVKKASEDPALIEGYAKMDATVRFTDGSKLMPIRAFQSENALTPPSDTCKKSGPWQKGPLLTVVSNKRLLWKQFLGLQLVQQRFEFHGQIRQTANCGRGFLHAGGGFPGNTVNFLN